MCPIQNDMSRHPALHAAAWAMAMAALAAGHAVAQPSAFVPVEVVVASDAASSTVPPSTVPPNAAPAKPPASSLSTDDLRFVDEALMASEMEVAASELALKVSADPKVQAYARQMVKDHGAAADALRQIARDKGVTPQKRVPEAPEIARLRGLKPPQFEEAYIRTVAVDAHEQAVLLFQNQATRGKDAALRGYAEKMLPTLREHLKDGRAMEGRVTASAAPAKT